MVVALTRTLCPDFCLAHLPHTCQCLVRDLGLKCDWLQSRAHFVTTFAWRISLVLDSLWQETFLECDDLPHMHTPSTFLTGASPSYLTVCGKQPRPEMLWLHTYAHSLTTFGWKSSPYLSMCDRGLGPEAQLLDSHAHRVATLD